MNRSPSRTDVLAASTTSGLMAYLFDSVKEFPPNENQEFLAVVARIVGSGDGTLFEERDWHYLESTSGPPFFRGMRLLCKLIPLLDVATRDLMKLVSALVRLAGEDLAANQPYTAFREWCRGDPRRIRAVLNDARGGDALAIDHLGPALEAGASSGDALSFVKDGPGYKAQAAAATALSRMTLDCESATAAVRLLSEVSIQAENELLRSNALIASFAVLGKVSGLPRADAKRALDRAVSETDQNTLDALSILLWHHGEDLELDELRLVLKALKSVSHNHMRTLEQIDFSVTGLARRGYFEPLSALIVELIKRSGRKIQFATFPIFREELVDGDIRRLSKFTIDSFLEGDPYICADLAATISSSSGPTKIIELYSEDLPTNPIDQLFVCRKCVGFLFHSPVTVASLIVSILRHGDARIHSELCDLIYSPVLISFEGDLRRYLEGISQREAEPIASLISEVIDRKHRILKNLSGIESLVEMHPTQSQRQIERVRWNRQMAQSMDEGMKKSVLHELVSKQYLLYGTSSSSYIDDLSGDTRRIDMELGSHSFSFEFPSLEVVDPEWLWATLSRFRFEKRIES